MSDSNEDFKLSPEGKFAINARISMLEKTADASRKRNRIREAQRLDRNIAVLRSDLRKQERL